MNSTDTDYSRYLSLVNKNSKLFIITALTIMTVVVVVSYLIPKKYEARSTVFIEKNVVSDLLKGISVNPSMDDSVMAMTYVLTSRTLLLKVINNVDFGLKTQNDAEIERLLDDIQRNIDIQTSDKGQSLFVVAFKHSNPKVARDFVNTLVQMYIEENISSKREESYAANKFLTEQIETYKGRLDKAQATVSQFKANKGEVVNVDVDRLLHDTDLAQQRKDDLDLRRRMLEEQKTYTERSSDPLQIKLVALNRRLGDLRSQYTDNFPEVIDTKAQIESLQQEIKSRNGGNADDLKPEELWKINAELNAIEENQKIVKQYIAKNNELLAAIPRNRSNLEKLEAEQNNEKTMYDLLSIRQGHSEVSKQMEMQDKSTTFRVVDPAVTPAYPVSPNRKKIMLLGIAIGFAAGFGLVIGRDYLDDTIKTVDSLKTFGLPVLAIVPLIKSEDEIESETKSRLRVFIWGGAYFSVIILILAMEAVGVKYIDVMADRVHLPPVVAGFFERF